MVAGTGYYIYLSLHGQRCINIDAQVLHGTCYMGSLLSNLKLDFVTYFKLVFRLEDNQVSLFFVKRMHICTHLGTDISPAAF